MFRLTDPLVLLPLALAARLLWGAVRPTARAPFRRVVLDGIFMTYLISLAKIVLGFAYLGGLGEGFVPWEHVNFVPFGSISEVARPALASAVLGQVVGNILLFVPFGVLLPLIAVRFRTFRSVFVAGLLLSVGIEAIQLGMLLGRLMERSADVDDVILNTAGAVLGYAIWAILDRNVRRPAEKAIPAIEGQN